MKKSQIAMILTVLLIPVTIILGGRIPGRAYYLTSTLVLLEIMLPFFLAFEGRRPQARELVVIAVLCALAVAGRVLIPIPNFKATYAIIILSAVAFGPETGFLVGAVTALTSNFFFGQGPHTPWQMMAYGLTGLIAGFACRKKWLKPKKMPMAVFGAAIVVALIGPFLDICALLLTQSQITAAGALALLVSGLPINCVQAVVTFVVILLAGEPLLEKLNRVKLRYGMMEDEDGI